MIRKVINESAAFSTAKQLEKYLSNNFGWFAYTSSNMVSAEVGKRPNKYKLLFAPYQNKTRGVQGWRIYMSKVLDGSMFAGDMDASELPDLGNEFSWEASSSIENHFILTVKRKDGFVQMMMGNATYLVPDSVEHVCDMIYNIIG